MRSRRPEGLKRRGAHEGRRQWRKQAVVSPMKQGVPQASLRAQWNDHAELWNSAKRSADAEHRASEAQGGAKTRNDHAELRVGAKSEAAKRLKPRGAHEARALWAKQRGVSPMRQGEPQASLRSDAERPCRIVDTERSEVRSRRPEGLKRRGAHEGRRQWRKQAVVSPMKQGVPQASLRAQWNDHAELWNSAKRSARRGTPRKRSVERCEDAEHRTAKGECGAKRRKGG